MPKSSRAILLQARMSVSCRHRARKKGRPPDRPRKALTAKRKRRRMPAKHAKRREKGTGKGLLGELRLFAAAGGCCLQRRRSCKQLSPSNLNVNGPLRLPENDNFALRILSNFPCPFFAFFRVFRGQSPLFLLTCFAGT